MKLLHACFYSIFKQSHSAVSNYVGMESQRSTIDLPHSLDQVDVFDFLEDKVFGYKSIQITFDYKTAFYWIEKIAKKSVRESKQKLLLIIKC